MDGVAELPVLAETPSEVTLRRPPPLGRPLEVQRLEGGRVALRDGETFIARATWVRLA